MRTLLMTGDLQRARHVLSVAAVAVLMACGDASTSPQSPRGTAGGPNAAMIGGAPPAWVGVQDAIDRILPTFGDAADTKGLKEALEGVVESLERSDKAAALGSADRAMRVLDRLSIAAEASLGNGADLDAVRLALETAIVAARP